MSKQRSEQFNEGYQARMGGEGIQQNPYLVKGRERSSYDWRAGWTAADSEIYRKKNGICNQLKQKGA